MKKYELLMAAELLEAAAEYYSNFSFNEYEPPLDDDDLRTFLEEYSARQGEDEEELEALLEHGIVDDYVVMRMLAEKMRAEAEEGE